MAFSRILFCFGVLVFVCGFQLESSQAASNSFATPLSPSLPHSDFAELCRTADGQHMAVRGFGGVESLVVTFGSDPTGKPKVDEGFKFVRQSMGLTERSEVSFEMFEMMAETFGGVEQDQSQWKTTYEETFTGNIEIFDTKGKSVGMLPVKCNAAIIDFK